MRSRVDFCVLTFLVPAFCLGQSGSCEEQNRLALQFAAAGDLLRAEAQAGSDPGCAGLVFNNLAATMSIAGRSAEAERLARQSVQAFERGYSPSSHILLRPLQAIAAAALDEGKLRSARSAFERMRMVQIDGPSDRALLHGLSAALLTAEGRVPEAKSEYETAIDALREAGRSETADAAALWSGLATLYLLDGDLTRASGVMDRVLAILEVANDAVPTDRVKALYCRAAILVREKDWTQAEQALRGAVALADRNPQPNAILSPVLKEYALVLRKRGRRRESAAVARQLAALGAEPTARGVVDVTELHRSARTGLR
jgi:tetratricopeptide (TPR) repeat protein